MNDTITKLEATIDPIGHRFIVSEHRVVQAVVTDTQYILRIELEKGTIHRVDTQSLGIPRDESTPDWLRIYTWLLNPTPAEIAASKTLLLDLLSDAVATYTAKARRMQDGIRQMREATVSPRSWEELTPRQRDATIGLRMGTVSQVVYKGYMQNADDRDARIQRHGLANQVPHYTSEFSAAMEAFEHNGTMGTLSYQGTDYHCSLHAGWNKEGHGISVEATGDSAPEVIGHAVFLALQPKEEEV